MKQRGITIFILFMTMACAVLAQDKKTAANGNGDSSYEEKNYALLIEYLRIEGELQEIKSLVMLEDEVVSQKKYLDNLLEMHLVSKKPDLIQRIKKYKTLSEELAGSDMKDEPEKWGEMKTLELDLDNRKKELLKSNPELREAKDNFDELVEAKMIEADSSIAEKIKRLKEIRSVIRPE